MPSCRSVRAPFQWTTDRSIHYGVTEWSLCILWQGRGARRPPGCEHELPKLRGVSFFDNAKHTAYIIWGLSRPKRLRWTIKHTGKDQRSNFLVWHRCSWNFRDFQLIHGHFWMELLIISCEIFGVQCTVYTQIQTENGQDWPYGIFWKWPQIKWPGL